MTDERAICAALNNADLYEAVFSVHGLGYQRKTCAFVARDDPPPYYSNLTTLSPQGGASVLRDLRRLSVQFKGVLNVKDSFCRLDLAANGFQTLFQASWIWREPKQVAMADGWDIVRKPEDLTLWEEGWKSFGSPAQKRIFPQAFLSLGDVVVIGQKVDGRFVAGCIANRSENCIGLSNVFAKMPSAEQFSMAATAAAAPFECLPVVGYEAGAGLTYARQCGFETTGKLRILRALNARF